MPIQNEIAIRNTVRTAIEAFADGFYARHHGEKDNPEGTINSKIHNVFIAMLGDDIQYYSALVRSLDSSLGNMLEKMAINIARLFYDVEQSVTGELYPEQTRVIAELLESYKNRNDELKPATEHFKLVRDANKGSGACKKTHISDYYIYDPDQKIHYLIELKIGGDLDNKKARSEKEAIFEQYAILSNQLGPSADIRCFFGTAYNRFGEDKPWRQQRVRQFFSDDELLIGRDFWNFICKSSDGYDIIIDAYKEHAHLIRDNLDQLKTTYLG